MLKDWYVISSSPCSRLVESHGNTRLGLLFRLSPSWRSLSVTAADVAGRLYAVIYNAW